VCDVLENAGHGNIASGMQKAALAEVVKFMKPLEDAAKKRSNSLENLDLVWLRNHIDSQEEDSDFLSTIKENARAELACIEALMVIEKCKSIVILFENMGPHAFPGNFFQARSRNALEFRFANVTKFPSKLLQGWFLDKSKIIFGNNIFPQRLRNNKCRQ